MSPFPENMKCPVCLDILTKHIFQCRNGHVLCHVCSIIVTICPQCRVSLGVEKIRNRAVEELLDEMRFDCVYKNCSTKTTRQEFMEHKETCLKGGDTFKFCKLFNISCDVTLNTRKMNDFVAHFETHFEKRIPRTKDERTLKLSSLNKLNRKKSKILDVLFTQTDFSEKTTSAIILLYNKEDQTISPICLQIYHDADCETSLKNNIRVEFLIKPESPKMPDLVCNTTPINIRHAELFLKHAFIRWPLDFLLSNYAPNNCLTTGFQIYRETLTQLVPT